MPGMGFGNGIDAFMGEGQGAGAESTRRIGEARLEEFLKNAYGNSAPREAPPQMQPKQAPSKGRDIAQKISRGFLSGAAAAGHPGAQQALQRFMQQDRQAEQERMLAYQIERQGWQDRQAEADRGAQAQRQALQDFLGIERVRGQWEDDDRMREQAEARGDEPMMDVTQDFAMSGVDLGRTVMLPQSKALDYKARLANARAMASERAGDNERQDETAKRLADDQTARWAEEVDKDASGLLVAEYIPVAKAAIDAERKGAYDKALKAATQKAEQMSPKKNMTEENWRAHVETKVMRLMQDVDVPKPATDREAEERAKALAAKAPDEQRRKAVGSAWERKKAARGVVKPSDSPGAGTASESPTPFDDEFLNAAPRAR